MGRLFWKFFLSILLAQVAATIGIGSAFWLKDRSRNQAFDSDLDTSPPARLSLEAAASTLEFGGAAALRGLLERMDKMERHRVFAVDEHDHELLARDVKPAVLADVRQMMREAPGQQRVVREISAADGHRYLLFLPSAEYLRGLGMAVARSQMAAIGRLEGPPGERMPPDETGARQGRAAQTGFGPDGPMAGGGGGGPRMEPPDWRGFPIDPRYRAFIPLAAAILASLLFAALLAWYFSRPIRALRLAFEAASGGDLAPRFSAASGGDELNDLGRDFDHMTGRLRSLIDGQTRLLHDVSHELRSPLARLQAAIGLAHQQPDKVQASLERIERESVRMDKLVGELLTLSRLEAGALGSIDEEISVAELVEAIVDDARFEAAAHQLQISLIGDADVCVLGHADLLGRAIENVVRNAIKHSPEGGLVALELGLSGDGRLLRIHVLDKGPGVANEELGAIFQPFFRGSGNGNGKTVDGHGLGLAIARHVVLAHRGAIIARNRDGGGLDVEISLPVVLSGKTEPPR